MEKLEPGDIPVDTRFITYRHVVDLSHPIHPGIPRWPGDPPVKFTTAATLESEGFRLGSFSMGEHSGTHMNAPISFHARDVGIDAYSPGSLVAPAVVVDVGDRAATDADYCLAVSHLADWEEKWGPVPAGCVVLLATGWSSKWEDPRGYLGYDGRGEMHFPAFGQEAARILLEERGAAGLGIDTHGLDPARDGSSAINKLVLEQPRIALENLANLDQLPAVGCTLAIGILRLKDGSGSPVSVLAFVP
ncbi:MAG: cyclase [SAR202 cluster bacterium Io17-Chloro-G2]|nr:MAG: cyclase [SAR202 cluster bacterium Io17-Chloro-G2]